MIAQVIYVYIILFDIKKGQTNVMSEVKRSQNRNKSRSEKSSICKHTSNTCKYVKYV